MSSRMACCCGCCCLGGVAGSCLGAVWMLLSLVATGLSCVAFYGPYWLQGAMAGTTLPTTHSSSSSSSNHHDNGWSSGAGGGGGGSHPAIPTYLGLWRRCNFLRADNDSIDVIMECGRYATFVDIPSVWWQVATVAMGAGCGVLVLVLLFNLFGCCCNDVITRTSSRICGYLQMIAGFLLSAGLALYPLGWKSTEVRRICGTQANIYSTGDCDIMWGMWVAVGGAGGAIFCSILGCSVSTPAYDDDKPQSRSQASSSFRQSRDNYMHVSTS